MPTVSRRHGQAAAGIHPPRRPRAVAGIAAAVAVCAALAGCASKTSPAQSVFTTRHLISLQQVQAEVVSLYSDHPAIASFAVQDVQYTAGSRDLVLRECTSGGTAAGSRDAETGHIVACAPLIFYFYSYGKQASVPAAVTVAGDLYWYAVTHITGPVNAKISLDELLRSWKLPVSEPTQTEQASAVAASVITAVA